MKRANSSKLSKLGLFDWASMLVLGVGSTLKSVSILMWCDRNSGYGHWYIRESDDSGKHINYRNSKDWLKHLVDRIALLWTPAKKQLQQKEKISHRWQLNLSPLMVLKTVVGWMQVISISHVIWFQVWFLILMMVIVEPSSCHDV